MTPTEPKSNRQHVQNALADFLDADEHNNSYRYFRAAVIADDDSDLSAAMVGTHLPKIEAESPLPNGLTIERHTDTQCRATLWVVSRNGETQTTDKQEERN